MSKISLKDIKKLRDETGAGLMEGRVALEEAGGKAKKAKEILKKLGVKKAAKRGDKATDEGFIFTYVHQGRIGAMVKLLCETDFVARSSQFQKLGAELALQIASMEPKNVEALLKQEYIRDNKTKIADLVAAAAAKLKENIKVDDIARLALK